MLIGHKGREARQKDEEDWRLKDLEKIHQEKP